MFWCSSIAHDWTEYADKQHLFNILWQIKYLQLPYQKSVVLYFITWIKNIYALSAKSNEH